MYEIKYEFNSRFVPAFIENKAGMCSTLNQITNTYFYITYIWFHDYLVVIHTISDALSHVVVVVL